MRRALLVLPLALGAGCRLADCDEACDLDSDSDAPAVDTDALHGRLAVPAYALVGAEVVVDARSFAGAVEARFDFGDGGRRDRGPALSAPHAYERPGRFHVSVEVFAADGSSRVDEADVTVTWPLLDTPPRASSEIAVGGGRAFVALPDFDAVAVVELDTLTVEAHLHTCPHPRRVAFAPGDAQLPGLLAVTCEETRPGVALYDVGDAVTPRAALDLTGTGRTPFGVVIDDERTTWVTARGRGDDGGVLLGIDGEGHVAHELSLGDDLRGLAWAPGALFVSRHRSPDDGGRIWKLDLPSLDAHELVLPVDTVPDSDSHSRGVPTYAEPIAVRPDGRVLAFGGLKANLLKGLVRDGVPLTQESTVRAELGVLALDPGEGELGDLLGEVRLDNLDLVSAVAFGPRGDRLYAALRGNHVVAVVDAATRGVEGFYLDVGDVPEALVVDPVRELLLVDAAIDRELVVYRLGDEPSFPPTRVDLRPGGVEALDPDVLAGARIFATSADPRMTKDAYVSCASCHLDAEQDGRVWDFTQRGEGLRNTITLRGMADRAGLPIHWSGNFDEVQDFEADIRGPQAGTGFLADALYDGPAGPTLGDPKAGLSPELDQLAAYVEHFRDLDVPWDADTSEGEAIFEAAGCPECHPAETDFSASSWDVAAPPRYPHLVDVGTLGPLSGHRLGGDLPGLDVPSLRGAWATAPYLHDGSAATLLDVVTPCATPASRGCNRDDRHGVTSDLSPDDLAALVRFLRSL
jgi:hypothetical protein